MVKKSELKDVATIGAVIVGAIAVFKIAQGAENAISSVGSGLGSGLQGLLSGAGQGVTNAGAGIEFLGQGVGLGVEGLGFGIGQGVTNVGAGVALIGAGAGNFLSNSAIATDIGAIGNAFNAILRGQQAQAPINPFQAQIDSLTKSGVEGFVKTQQSSASAAEINQATMSVQSQQINLATATTTATQQTASSNQQTSSNSGVSPILSGISANANKSTAQFSNAVSSAANVVKSGAGAIVQSTQQSVAAKAANAVGISGTGLNTGLLSVFQKLGWL